MTFPVLFLNNAINIYLFFINYIFFVLIHKRIPTKNSTKFNDILFNIKTNKYHYNDPLRVFVTDKMLAKYYIKSVVGEKYVVPTLNFFTNLNDFKKFKIKNDIVIKPSHSCGHIIFGDDFKKEDYEIIKNWFEENYFHKSLEYFYYNLKPGLLVEPLIFKKKFLNDYKFFCNHGKVKLIQVDADRHKNHVRAMYTKEWKKLNFSISYPFNSGQIKKPGNLQEMIIVAEKLASAFDYIRIDLYSNEIDIKVGEITNCHGNAHEKIITSNTEKNNYETLFFFEKNEII